MMGESPTRPGIFHASPEVVVVAEMSPFSFTAMHGIVPVGGCWTTRWAYASKAWSSGVSPKMADNLSFHSGLSMPGRQLSEVDAFHASQTLRECSVRRF